VLSVRYFIESISGRRSPWRGKKADGLVVAESPRVEPVLSGDFADAPLMSHGFSSPIM
jgi:hypothetical protein